jgi:hypothetical protein
MASPRASIFDDPDELDVSSFVPKSMPDSTAPPPEKVREVSEAAQFHSREPGARASGPAEAEPRREQRRYRTGRNVQFNVKASQQTIDAFYSIADREGWVLGETLEHALAALQRELEANAGAPPRDQTPHPRRQ